MTELAHTPPGRIVQGDLFSLQTKDMEGNLREKPTFFFALAIPKTHADTAALVQWIYTMGAHVQPQTYNVHGFAWKMVDGDLAPPTGKTAYPEHFRGCWVLKFATLYAINVVDINNQPTTGGVKCGDYAEVGFTVTSNKQTNRNPGIFLNPSVVRFCGYGEAIKSEGATPEQAFGAGAGQLAPGASATPVGGAAPMPQAAPGGAAPGGSPAPPTAGAPAAAAPQAAAQGAVAPPDQAALNAAAANGWAWDGAAWVSAQTTAPPAAPVAAAAAAAPAQAPPAPLTAVPGAPAPTAAAATPAAPAPPGQAAGATTAPAPPAAPAAPGGAPPPNEDDIPF